MPTNPFQQTQATTDLHHTLGWPGIVYNDTGSTDSGDWVTRSAEENDFDDGTEITIRIEWPRNPKERRDASGREIWGDCVIIVDPSEATFTAGTEDMDASEIVDVRKGYGMTYGTSYGGPTQRYRVLRVRDSHTGLLRLDCEELT